MKATVLYRAGDIHIENVSVARIQDSTDAVIRITHACICRSDLWPYNDLEATPGGRPMGHEAIGVVDGPPPFKRALSVALQGRYGSTCARIVASN